MGRIAKFAGVGFLALMAVAAALYVTNPAPQVPAPELASPKPFVIKVHAQWCPVCMFTKGIWSEIASNYAGKVNLVVFDVTDEKRTEESRAAAGRLGLGDFFDEYGNWTGTVFVVDARTKQLQGQLHGDSDFEHYRAAIDQALR